MFKPNIKELPTLLPVNIDWAKYFNNNNPIDVELGCGRPHFFFDRAYNCEKRNIIGVEWKYEFVYQAFKRIKREDIKNAACFHGNAWYIIPLLFSSNSIENVFINFPDPWWKERHKKRLLLNAIFLESLKKRMKLNSLVFIQTDVKELFTHYKKLLNDDNNFTCENALTPQKIVQSLKAKTHREKKCQEINTPIYRQAFRLASK